MATTLDRISVRNCLEQFNLHTLFIEELGWNHGGEDCEAVISGHTFSLDAIAHKCGMVAFLYVAESNDTFPDYPTRQKIEKVVAKTVREHIIVYAPPDRTTQYWQWVKREPAQPDRSRFHIYHKGQTGEPLIQRLEHLVFALEEEEDLTIIDVYGRVRAAFDVETVTKRFYGRFKKEHDVFLDFIIGIHSLADREWYASLMLSRMMFIYFIQKRNFLDSDPDYLRNRLERMQQEQGSDRFLRFYRLFLLRLFHEGLGQPEAGRAPELVALLGKVPYLNGGLFDVHELERDNPEIHIPDEAFRRIFSFFDAYQWHLDDRPLRNDNEINPDVLGYIFEKYINQKQMGAYYTKEDITGYISRNTVIPFLFDQAKTYYPIAFNPTGYVWRLLQDNPNRYFYDAVRHGITYDVHRRVELTQERELPSEIAGGMTDLSKRDNWNRPAPDHYALPTETWREHITRRQLYDEISAKLASGEVTSIEDLITYNLDIEKFAQDVITQSERPELIHAFWRAINKVSILDPTCGSGAFLFAALNILEPLYVACLDAMRGLINDLDRSEREHHPETMNHFQGILERVAAHASERYFILKSIVVENLYGVDIMEEAVEICKLRLFLKLVAQLDNYEQIEPLPDLDFNIRSGNTLVGLASLDETRRALGSDMVRQLALPKIEEQAEITDRAFHLFRQMQTEHGMHTVTFSTAKAELRKRLDKLRTELDQYLAEDYGIKTDDEEEYTRWRESHQPFHWFVEFYGIMHNGGFDVIIGNPPYLEAREVPYSVRYFACEDSGAVHAMCIERSLQLCASGCVSMIVPLALVSTQRMTVIQRMLEADRNCWYSNFSWRPGKLFDTVDRALTIFITTKAKHEKSTFSTAYQRWNSKGRDYLIPTIRYVVCPKTRTYFWAPKIGHDLEKSILSKCMSSPKTMGDFTGRSSDVVYYRTTGGLYWKVFTDFPPAFYVNGVASSSSRQTSFALANKRHVKSAVAVLSSGIFWWWYTITSNLRDLNPSDWKKFPTPKSAMNDPDIQMLGNEYIADLRKNSSMRTRNQKSTGRTETQSFKVQKSKHIIDQIDKVLASHYGFDYEEIDFILNYDIKYRVSEIEM